MKLKLNKQLSAILIGLIAMHLAATPSSANDLTVNFTNGAASDITAITATAKSAVAAEPTNLITAPIAVGETGTATLQAADGECLFDLTYTFSSGATQILANSDLCQTDTIIVE